MFERKMLKHFDFILFITMVSIIALGIVIIASATHYTENGLTRQVKVQTIAFGLGLLVILFMLLVDYNYLGELYKIVYVLSILMLLMVYIPGLGVIRGGARSWIDIGPIDIQTSELAKIGFILSYGKFLESRYGNISSIGEIMMALIFPLPFLLLILMQPDLGSALVFAVITAGMLFVAGMPWRFFIGGGAFGIAMIPVAYRFMGDHQKRRIDAFLNPSNTDLPGNYHVRQSKITIGSGQLKGKGLFMGTQTRYDFLPVQETDFIFAVLVEELGFVGGACLILLYFILLYRMFSVARNAKDAYGTLLVSGIISMFLYQIVQNIGMTMGVMPVTGVTLPFMSYGGSSLIISMAAIGIVLGISLRKQKIKF